MKLASRISYLSHVQTLGDNVAASSAPLRYRRTMIDATPFPLEFEYVTCMEPSTISHRHCTLPQCYCTGVCTSHVVQPQRAACTEVVLFSRLP